MVCFRKNASDLVLVACWMGGDRSQNRKTLGGGSVKASFNYQKTESKTQKRNKAMSCEKCGREIKNYGLYFGGIRCANYCRPEDDLQSRNTEKNYRPPRASRGAASRSSDRLVIRASKPGR